MKSNSIKLSTTTTDLINEKQNLQKPNQDTSTIPRNLSIRFAPLPDPRASRAHVPGRLGQLDVWWSRLEKLDGTWGDYRLVLRRPDGQIVAIDDLDPNSIERIRALESYQQHPPSKPTTPSSTTKPNFWDLDSNLTPSDSLSSSSISTFSTNNPKSLITPLHPINSNLNSSYSQSNPPSANSISLSNPLTLTPTPSCDSTHSNLSSSLNQKSSITSSLTKKFLDAMKKPVIKHSHRLTPTNSLPIHGHYVGEPLHKTRSVDSTTSTTHRKRFSFGFNKNSHTLRRTFSKEDSISEIGFDEPPVRRRSNYPPVAQRKAHMGGGRGGAGKVVLVEEPDFVEWKPASTTASTSTVNSLPKTEPLIEDDGSGMAWLRKRKREREERAKREQDGNTSITIVDSKPSVPGDSHENQISEIESNPKLNEEMKTNPRLQKKESDPDSSASSIYQSSILSKDEAQASVGTRTSTSSITTSSKDFNLDEDEDLNEEELKEEERLKALALIQSPFVKGASEVFRDRGHHQILSKSSQIN